jgi:hypothetical protein
MQKQQTLFIQLRSRSSCAGRQQEIQKLYTLCDAAWCRCVLPSQICDLKKLKPFESTEVGMRKSYLFRGNSTLVNLGFRAKSEAARADPIQNSLSS